MLGNVDEAELAVFGVFFFSVLMDSSFCCPEGCFFDRQAEIGSLGCSCFDFQTAFDAVRIDLGYEKTS